MKTRATFLAVHKRVFLQNFLENLRAVNHLECAHYLAAGSAILKMRKYPWPDLPVICFLENRCDLRIGKRLYHSHKDGRPQA
jgi:hypothetical protein